MLQFGSPTVSSPREGKQQDDFNAYRIALAKAGMDITNALVPATNSMHESVLHNVRGDYKLNSVDGVNKSLDKDLIRHRAKYLGTPSQSSARFTVELPTSPQHQKYCWGSKQPARGTAETLLAGFSRQSFFSMSQGVDDPDSMSIDQPWFDVARGSGSKEEVSYAGIRASLFVSSAVLEGMLQQEGNPMSETDKAVARIVVQNRLKLESLDKIFQELDQNQSGLVSRRAVAIRLTQKFLLGSGEGLSLQTPVFCYLKTACSAFEKTTAPLTKEKFIEYCKFAGLMIQYEMDMEASKPKTTRGARAGNLLCVS